MFQRDANTFLCGEHHFEAEEFPATDRQPISSRASATKRMPPTPSMTPGTQQLLNLVATKPRVEEPSTQNHKRKKVDKSRNSLKLIDEMHEVSPRTQAAAEVAAKYAVMSLNNFSIGTTASINSVDLLNKMLETRSDANLMINGNLDVGGEATGPRPRYWTEEEDDMLQKAVEQYGAKNWKTIAAFVPGRTHVQCLQRWNKVLKPGLRKGIWTEDENNILLEFVREMEPNVDWAEISNRIPGRSAKQCRERWTFNLDPNINKVCRLISLFFVSLTFEFRMTGLKRKTKFCRKNKMFWVISGLRYLKSFLGGLKMQSKHDSKVSYELKSENGVQGTFFQFI